MPKSMSSSRNFSKTAQTRFDKFIANSNWSWLGLAMALITKFGICETEKFHVILGEVIKQLGKEK